MASTSVQAILPDAASSPKPYKGLVVFMLGPPGAGKGTLCSYLKEHYGYQVASMGDIIRARLSPSGVWADRDDLRRRIQEGKLLYPDDVANVALEALRSAAEKDTNNIGIILDGFPRSLVQKYSFENLISAEFYGHFARDVPDVCVLATAEREICLLRYMSRGRDGDSIDLFKHRYDGYLHDEMAVLAQYDLSKRTRIVRINTDGPAAAEGERLNTELSDIKTDNAMFDVGTLGSKST